MVNIIYVTDDEGDYLKFIREDLDYETFPIQDHEAIGKFLVETMENEKEIS